MTHDDRPRIELNWVQALAAPLAAVTSAVLLSTFGVAGTLIGAALGSLALTVGNAVYSYSIKATRHRVAAAQTVAAARIGLAQSRVDEMSAEGGAAADTTAHELAETREDLDRAQAVLDDADPDPAPGGWRGMLVALPWKRIVLLSTAVFVTAMLMILAFELTTGRALSSYTGSDDRRTSIPGWGDRSETEQNPIPRDDGAPADQAPGEEDVLPPAETDPTADTTAPAQTAEPSPTPTAPTPAPVEPTPESVETAPAEPTPDG
jgi:hypothetical protein